MKNHPPKTTRHEHSNSDSPDALSVDDRYEAAPYAPQESIPGYITAPDGYGLVPTENAYVSAPDGYGLVPADQFSTTHDLSSENEKEGRFSKVRKKLGRAAAASSGVLFVASGTANIMAQTDALNHLQHVVERAPGSSAIFAGSAALLATSILAKKRQRNRKNDRNQETPGR